MSIYVLKMFIYLFIFKSSNSKERVYAALLIIDQRIGCIDMGLGIMRRGDILKNSINVKLNSAKCAYSDCLKSRCVMSVTQGKI